MVAPALLELKEIMRTEQMQAKKMEIYSEVHAHTRCSFVQKLYVFTIAVRQVFEGDYVFY